MSTASSQVKTPLLIATGLLLRERLSVAIRWLLEVSDRYVGGNTLVRFAAILLVYAVELGVVFYLSYELRWDFATPDDFQRQRLTLLIPIVICKLILLQSFGQFRSVLSYFGLADFGGVVIAMSTVSGFMLALWYGSEVSAAPSRGVILMDFVLSVALISAFRLSLRVARTWSIAGPAQAGLVERRVAIVGAGDIGEALAKDLLQRRGSGLTPILFIDNNPNKIGRTIHSLPVYGPLEKLLKLAPMARVNELVITLKNAGPKQVKEIVELGRQIGATTQIIPSFTQLASGEVKIERSRPVAIEDLLGRAPVNLDSAGITRLLRDRVRAGNRCGWQHRERIVPADFGLPAAPAGDGGANRDRAL